MRFGGLVLGMAAFATGITNLIWGAFDPAEEPIAAWGNNPRDVLSAVHDLLFAAARHGTALSGMAPRHRCRGRRRTERCRRRRRNNPLCIEHRAQILAVREPYADCPLDLRILHDHIWIRT